MTMIRSDYISIGALLVSVAAAVFTGLQWHDTREQNKLSLTPRVDFYIQTDKVDPPMGLALINHGPGTAIIKSVTYYVDGDVAKDADAAEKLGQISSDLVDETTLEKDDSMSVGETVWLLSRSSKSKKELEKFADFIDQHLAALVTYCALNGECWQKCSDPGRCQEVDASSPHG